MDPSEQFDVVIVGFAPADESAEARLQRGFGIDESAAAQLVATLPRAVQRAVPRVRAEYFRRALVLLGAAVEVYDGYGQFVAEEHTAENEEPPQPVASAVTASYAKSEAPPWSHDEVHAATDACRAVAAMPHASPGTTVAIAAASGAVMALDERALPFVRAPAHATTREVLTPELAPLSARVLNRSVETEPPSAALQQSPRAAAAAPNPPASVATPRSKPSPAAAAPLMSSPAEMPWSSVPPGVWDSTPSPPRSRAVGKVAAVYQEPLPKAPGRGLRAPALPASESARAASAAAANFDLTKSIALNAVWRPPTPAVAAHGAGAPASELTLDLDPQLAAELKLQAAWEQPNNTSMAEPVLRPAARSPVSRRPLAAEGAAVIVGRKPSGPAGAIGAERKIHSNPVRSARAPAPAQASDSPPVEPTKAVAVASRPAPKSSERVDLRSFWQTFGEALSVPFGGRGVYWIAAIAVWGVLVGLIDLLSGFALFAGWILMFCAHTSLFALVCDYYRVCLWVPAAGGSKLEQAPDLEPVRVFERYVRSGLHLSLFMLVSQVPLIWSIAHAFKSGASLLEVLTDPVIWLIGLLPYFYWPMGVALTAINNEFSAIWRLPTGFRAILRAPLEYAAIVSVGVLAFAISWSGLLLFGSFFGVTGALLSGTIGLPLAISHGLQGALMGHLVRARAEIFE